MLLRDTEFRKWEETTVQSRLHTTCNLYLCTSSNCINSPALTNFKFYTHLRVRKKLLCLKLQWEFKGILFGLLDASEESANTPTMLTIRGLAGVTPKVDLREHCIMYLRLC